MAKGSILLVEDEKNIAEAVKYALEKEGFRALIARDGLKGLEAARRERPDLILLDLMMPEVSGFDVLSELAAEPATSRIPVVIVSAKSLAEEDKQFLTHQVQLVIQKAGFDTTAFLREVSRVIQSRRPGPSA